MSNSWNHSLVDIDLLALLAECCHFILRVNYWHDVTMAGMIAGAVRFAA
jgi:hypothetical protein